MPDNRKQKKIIFLIGAAIIAATVIAYEPMRHNGFVGYDDDKYITNNPNINEGITRDSVTGAFTQFHFHMWHPLSTLSNIIDCQIFGLKPFWHHFVNLIIHIANALLLLFILRRLTDSLWVSAFIAAVFALHPLQVEAIAWAAERKTALSGLFWFLTIWVYIWYSKRPDIRRYILLLLIYGLCIMTKPSVVTLPFVLLILDYWPLGRFDGLKPILQKKQLLAEKAPLFLMSGILCVITVVGQKGGGAIADFEKIPFDSRLGNMFVSYMRYIGKMIWPSELSVFYPRTQYSDAVIIICAVLFLLITAASIYIGRHKKYILAGWLWFAGTLVPMIGIIQAGAQAMANRYMYISMTGLLIIIAMWVKEVIVNQPRLKNAAFISAVILLSILVFCTRQQVNRWENNLTLFEYASQVTETNSLVENNYGTALLERGRAKEAELHLANAVKLNPGYYDAYTNLGAVYVQTGQYESAINNFNKALELKPDYTDALNNMAWLLATSGNPSYENPARAVELAQRACELTKYKNPSMLDTLAAAYAADGKFDEAVKTARQALEIAKTKKEGKLANEIEGRLKLYQSKQRYRQK